MSYSDLNELIKEINNYVVKTKGTTDFSVIQNKVERKLNMRYDQSMSLLSFPTYLGLMGTFLGVFLGITMFISGFDNAGNISDDSIKNLLSGVLVSAGAKALLVEAAVPDHEYQHAQKRSSHGADRGTAVLHQR